MRVLDTMLKTSVAPAQPTLESPQIRQRLWGCLNPAFWNAFNNRKITRYLGLMTPIQLG